MFLNDQVTMITKEKLEIFKKYSGNIENWDRFGKTKDKSFMDYEEWELIDKLIHHLELINKGLVSCGFKTEVQSKLEEVVENEETIKELRSLVGKY